MKRPTLRDIAAIAQVSHVTVSLALRQHPSIPKGTRERIEGIAQQIGYRPDPALSALMSYRRGAKPSNFQAILAWIDCYRTHQEPDLADLRSPYYAGVQERCDQLGYQVERFRLADVDMRFSRLSDVLYARNIRGLLFAPQERSFAHISALNFKWDRFSSISFGFSLASPQLHVICHAQYRSARLAVRKLRSLGYRRIGFAFNGKIVERTDSNFLGGYLTEQLRLAIDNRIPPLTYNTLNGPEFKNWCTRYKPDAIYTSDAERLSTIIEREGLPKCAIASSDLPEGGSRFAGIVQNSRLVGRLAVDEVISMMHSDERGVPAVAKCILVPGYWQEGSSAPGQLSNVSSGPLA